MRCASRPASIASAAPGKKIQPGSTVLCAMDETRQWWSYAPVAEPYDRLAVPYVSPQPATDLVSMLRLPRGARALDVGAGTGVAALALQSATPGGLIVALDSSLGMLRAA